MSVGAAQLLEVHDPGLSFAIVFIEVEPMGTAQPIENEELRRVDPDELAGLELAPADRAS